MGLSHRLRNDDIAGVFEVVQDLRDAWADAAAWQERLLQGMCRLTGLAVGLYIEHRLSADGSSVCLLDTADRGWRDAAARSRFMRLFDDHPDLVRFLPGCARLASSAVASASVVADPARTTLLRQQIVIDRVWYTSCVFNDYYRPAQIDGYVLSFAAARQSGRGAQNKRTGAASDGKGGEDAGVMETQVMLCACQGADEPPPTARARAVVALLNQQVAPLVGRVLATRRHHGRHELPPRLQQSLDALLTGASEKQIAALLGIRPTTAHEHIGRLYAHFGVASRAELMAYFIARTPSAAAAAGSVPAPRAPHQR